MRRIACAIAVVAFITPVAGAGASPATGRAPVRSTGGTAPTEYDVAFGDSLSVGYAAPAGKGYVDDLYAYEHKQHPGLLLKDFGCSGETTATFIHGGHCQGYAHGSQLADGLNFLEAHRGRIGLVTIDIGGNDFLDCPTGPNPLQCFATALQAMDTNVRTIMSQLRSAAGPAVEFVGMTYPAPRLYLWFNGPTNQQLARAVVAGEVLLNAHLTNDNAAYHAKTADVDDAFAITDYTIVDSEWGRIPRNVALECTWMDIGCGEGHGTFGNDANAAGYTVIAGQFMRQLSTVSVGVNGGYRPFSGDFDCSGTSDVFWYAPGTAPDSIWFGNTDGAFTSRGYTVNGTAYQPIVGDFNGDGCDDILWYVPGRAPDYMWYGSASHTFATKAFTANGNYRPVGGDFNGDGRADIFWYAPGPTNDYLWLGRADGTFHSQLATANGDYIPAAGDFNGDGRADVLMYAPGPDSDYLLFGTASGAFSSRPISQPGDFTPVVADFSGDHRADILWYAPGIAPDQIWFATNELTTFSVHVTNVSGDLYRPVAGDFNDDGRADLLWYAPGATPDVVWFDVPHDLPPPPAGN